MGGALALGAWAVHLRGRGELGADTQPKGSPENFGNLSAETGARFEVEKRHARQRCEYEW